MRRTGHVRAAEAMGRAIALGLDRATTNEVVLLHLYATAGNTAEDWFVLYRRRWVRELRAVLQHDRPALDPDSWLAQLATIREHGLWPWL